MRAKILSLEKTRAPVKIVVTPKVCNYLILQGYFGIFLAVYSFMFNIILILAFMVMTLSTYAFEERGDIAVFTEEEAIEYIKQEYNDISGVTLESAPQISRALDQIYQAFISYGFSKENFPKPVIVFTNDLATASHPVENAEGRTLQSNIITCQTEDFPLPSIETLYGTLAHEMAHYFSKHGFRQGYEAEIVSVSVDTVEGCDVCNQNLPESEELKDRLVNYLDDMEVIGHHIVPELHFIPVDIYGESDTYQIFNHLLDGRTESLACTATFSLYETIHNDSLLGNYQKLTQEFSFTSDESKKLEENSLNFIEKGKECFSLIENKSLVEEAFESAIGLSVSNFVQYVTENQEVMEEMGTELLDMVKRLLTDNPMEVLIDINKLAYRKMQEEEFIHKNYKRIRYISDEDEADLLGAKILFDAQLFPEDAHRYLINFDSTPEERVACEELINKNIEPPYGSLVDTHHASCWRAWRVKKLIQEEKKVKETSVVTVTESN